MFILRIAHVVIKTVFGLIGPKFSHGCTRTNHSRVYCVFVAVFPREVSLFATPLKEWPEAQSVGKDGKYQWH